MDQSADCFVRMVYDSRRNSSLVQSDQDIGVGLAAGLQAFNERLPVRGQRLRVEVSHALRQKHIGFAQHHRGLGQRCHPFVKLGELLEIDVGVK